MTCADLLEDEDPETEVYSELGCVVLRDLVGLTGFRKSTSCIVA